MFYFLLCLLDGERFIPSQDWLLFFYRRKAGNRQFLSNSLYIDVIMELERSGTLYDGALFSYKKEWILWPNVQQRILWKKRL